MKKATISLLAALLCFGLGLLTGCDSLPFLGDKTDNEAASSGVSSAAASKPASSAVQKPADAMGGRLAAVYQKMLSSKSFSLHAINLSDAGGIQVQAEVWSSAKGDVTGTRTVAETMGMKMDMHVVTAEGKVYMVNHSSKTYALMTDMSAMQEQGLGLENAENMAFLSEGTDTVDGKKLPYEEYAGDSDETVRYYFDGKQLYAIVVKTGDTVSVMRILELKDKPDDSLLTIPADYTEDATGAGGILGDLGLSEEDLKALEDAGGSGETPQLSESDLSALENLDLSALENLDLSALENLDLSALENMDLSQLENLDLNSLLNQ